MYHMLKLQILSQALSFRSWQTTSKSMGHIDPALKYWNYLVCECVLDDPNQFFDTPFFTSF